MIKGDVVKKAQKALYVYHVMRTNPQLSAAWIKQMHEIHPLKTPTQIIEILQDEEAGWNDMYNIASKSNTVLFSGKQAEIFMDIAENYTSPLEYLLPFEYIIIEFTEPISVEITSDYDEVVQDRIIGIALSQTTITQEHVDHAIKVRDGIKQNPFNQLSIPESALLVGSVVNVCLAIYEDLEMLRIGWISNGKYETLSEEVVKPDLIDDRTRKVIKYQRLLKNLALCCIGYINCENIYIKKEGEVPDAVNRKRETKGKSRIEPYYVCRIKGVQYDSHATGSGVKHGIRYDVRGHFRRLDSGKTIWVRPHQRGLQNELYIPKVYNVAKDSKPGWKAEQEKGD